MLHGKIEVNGVAVGYWEAVRGETVMKNAHRYSCKLFYRHHQSGDPMHAEFEVIHHEPMGAAWLAHMVLANGVKKLKGYPPGGPNEFPV